MKMKSILCFVFFIFVCQFSFASVQSPLKKHHYNVNYDQNGLFVTRDDNLFSFNPYGYFEQDFIKFTNDHNLLKSGTNVRYAMLYLSGNLYYQTWQYLVSYSFSLSKLLDASIIYRGFKRQYIQIGQFTPDVGFSNWSRHLDINFLEWPLAVYAFSPGYPQGVHYNVAGDYLVADTSVFGGSTLSSYTRTNPVGGTGHVFFSPIHTSTRALHIGISDWWQQPNDNHTATFTTSPEANSHNNDVLVNTGAIPSVRYYNIISEEFAAERGPWTFQTEYYTNRVKRNRGQSNLSFKGGYATLGYFLTGESILYAYPLGAFTVVPVIKGPHGAFQVLLQYGTLDLDNKDIKGGKEYNTTLGLNWFVNHFITFKFNVIRADADPAFNSKKVIAMIYAARAQIQF